jgi:small subunit ribosomal protein S6
MREYELYLVTDADAEEDAAEAIVARMTELISTGDGTTAGEVIKVETRGKRRLAYPIQKKLEGQDIILSFQTPPQALTEMERILKLDERVLRYLIVRTDEK